MQLDFFERLPSATMPRSKDTLQRSRPQPDKAAQRGGSRCDEVALHRPMTGGDGNGNMWVLVIREAADNADGESAVIPACCHGQQLDCRTNKWGRPAGLAIGPLVQWTEADRHVLRLGGPSFGNKVTKRGKKASPAALGKLHSSEPTMP